MTTSQIARKHHIFDSRVRIGKRVIYVFRAIGGGYWPLYENYKLQVGSPELDKVGELTAEERCVLRQHISKRKEGLA